MTQYQITLADNRRVTAKTYLKILRYAQANPDAQFKESFRSSWISATGKELVREHWQMIHDKWAAQYPACGKGNRAKKRAQVIRDAKAECKWCGCLTHAECTRFCSNSCARDYNGF